MHIQFYNRMDGYLSMQGLNKAEIEISFVY